MGTTTEAGIKYLTEDQFNRDDWQPGAWQHWTYTRTNIQTREVTHIGIYVHTRSDLFALCNHWNRQSIMHDPVLWVYVAI